MSYKEIREVSKVDVLKHFTCIEATKSKYAKSREEMMNWIDLSESSFNKKFRSFEEQRKDENPFFGWTIGTKKNPDNWKTVKRWILANICLGSLFSRGMNSCINVHLELPNVMGNLKSFVIGGYAEKHKEIDTKRVPPQELRTFMGVAHRKEGYDGDIEVLDGNHRAMAMLANGFEKTEAYIAEIF